MDSHNLNAVLNQPNAQTQAAHWLAVEVSKTPYLVPLSHSGEIFPWSQPHIVPYTKAWFLGVVNLRGTLCGVVDLSKFFAITPVQNTELAAATGEKCFVGFHASLDLNTVLVVDQLLGLKNHSAMQPLQSTDTMQNEFVDSDGRVWREIDMFGLAKHADFVDIAAIY